MSTIWHVCMYLNDIILSSQVKHLPSNVERDHRQRGDPLTVDQVLQKRQRREENAEMISSMIHQCTAVSKMPLLQTWATNINCSSRRV